MARPPPPSNPMPVVARAERLTHESFFPSSPRFASRVIQGVSPDSFEESVAQALFDLEATSAELKGDLRDLYIMSAKEVDTTDGRKAVIIHVPFRLRKGFQKMPRSLSLHPRGPAPQLQRSALRSHCTNNRNVD